MIFRRWRWEEETGDEIRFHIERRAEDLERSGVPREEALRRARLEFGGVEGYKERCREARGARWIDEARRNLVYAFRSMRRSPGFVAVAVLSLALGIGANAAVFGLLHKLLLIRLPVHDPEGLYHVVLSTVRRAHPRLSYPKFEMLRDNFDLFSAQFAWGAFGREVSVEDRREFVRTAVVTGAYFDSLGLRPALGRLLTPQDERARGAEAAVISHALWQNWFAGDPGVVGRSLRVGPEAFQIAGVAPPGFTGLEPGFATDVYLPLHAAERFNPGVLQREGNLWMHTMVRLKPGAPLDTAQTVLREKWAQLDEPMRLKRRDNSRPEFLVLEDGSRGLSPVRREFSRAVLVLMALVAAVFLIACANLATLLFVRGSGRAREMTIRLAMGAGRAHLVRQWMTECLLLSLLGGAAGLLLARWITALLLLFVAPVDRSWLQFQASPAVLVLTITLTLAAGFLFGLLPAIRASRIHPEMLARAHSASLLGRRGRLAELVLAGQLAASLVLVVGAALFVRTLWNLNSAFGGFDRKTSVYGVANWNRARFPRDRASAGMSDALGRVRLSPHMAAASLGMPPIVFGGSGGWSWVTVPGYTLAPGEDNVGFGVTVAPGYFRSLGIPLLAGRDFEERDRARGAQRVVIVNDKVARHYFAGKDAVGQRILWGHPNPNSLEIVGVVGDIKDAGLREPHKELLYSPLPADGVAVIVARAKPGVAASVAEAEVRSALTAAFPGVPVETGHLEEAVQRSLGRDRLVAQLSAAFGLLGVVLACIGLYGAMAHAVTSRTREIGIRIAVGAGAWDVIGMVLKQSLRVTGLGILIGLPAAMAASRLIASLLFEVSPSDPLTLAVSAAVLGTAGLAAGWWPARRAARLDPSQTLRCE
jgi:predicted permease